MLTAILYLLVILFYWTCCALLTPYGWRCLKLAILAVFDKSKRPEAKAAWIEFDKKINARFKGNPSQTISGRVGYKAIKTKAKRYRVAQSIINTLFWFDEDHCFNAINWELYPDEEQTLTLEYYVG